MNTPKKTTFYYYFLIKRYPENFFLRLIYKILRITLIDFTLIDYGFDNNINGKNLLKEVKHCINIKYIATLHYV
jgi:hypothetical protein